MSESPFTKGLKRDATGKFLKPERAKPIRVNFARATRAFEDFGAVLNRTNETVEAMDRSPRVRHLVATRETRLERIRRAELDLLAIAEERARTQSTSFAVIEAGERALCEVVAALHRARKRL